MGTSLFGVSAGVRGRHGQLLAVLAVAATLVAGLVAFPMGPVQAVTGTLVNALTDGRPVVRLDTDGNPLDAHDGQIVVDGGRYWLIGMAYSCGQEWPMRQTAGVAHVTCGVRAYSSVDLRTWHSEGYVLDGATMPATPAAACAPACWRAKVIRGQGGWVLWLNSPYHRTTALDYQVFASQGSAITGPYSWVAQRSLSAPAGGTGEDFTVYDDSAVSGNAYITSLSAGKGLYVQRLDATRTNVVGTPSLVGGAAAVRMWARIGPNATLGRAGEAPMMTRGPDGRAYVFVGAWLCGFCTQGAGLMYSAAASFDGPFPAPEQFIANACSTQSTSIAEVPVAEGGRRWLYQGDRWWESPVTSSVDNSANPAQGKTGNQGPASQWLEELTFDGAGVPRLTCHDSWTPDADFTLGARPWPASDADPLAATCSAAPGRTQTATVHVATTGDVDALQCNLLASLAPDAPARVTLTSASGVVVAGAALPYAANRRPPLTSVSWAPFLVQVNVGTTLAAGDYVLAVHHPGTKGCYGLLTTAENETAVTVIPSAASGGGPAVLNAITPQRIVDTRVTGGIVTAGTVRTVQVTGVGAIPRTGVAAVSMVVTTVGATTSGWVDVRPCTSGMNGTSTVNYSPGLAVAGSGLFAPDSNGRLCIQARSPVHVILDATGWIATDPTVRVHQAYRIADTRSGQGGVAVGQLSGGVARRVHTGAAPGSVVVLAVTDVQGSAAGWLAAVPCDARFPGTSTVNAQGGAVREAMAAVRVDTAGDVCLYANRPAHAVVDLFGVFRPQARVTQTNTRLIDTRATRQRLTAKKVFRVSSLSGGRVLTVTAVGPSGSGFLSVFPCDRQTTSTSTVNYQAGDVAVANSIMLTSSTAGICVRATTAVDVVVDSQATFAG